MRRRQVHIASEAAALVTVLPLSVYAASSRQLPAWARVGFAAVAVGTAVIDGALLASYLRRSKR